MKIFKFYLGILLFGMFALVGCDNGDGPEQREKDDINFNLEIVPKSDNYKVYISSPDPGCLGWFYYIVANAEGSEIELKATNVKSFDLLRDGESGLTKDIDSDGCEIYINEKARWIAKIVNDNILQLKFNQIEVDSTTSGELLTDFTPDVNRSWFSVKATDGSDIKRGMIVIRVLNYTQPLNWGNH